MFSFLFRATMARVCVLFFRCFNIVFLIANATFRPVLGQESGSFELDLACVIWDKCLFLQSNTSQP